MALEEEFIVEIKRNGRKKVEICLPEITLLTGYTGAGKSIFVEAIEMMLSIANKNSTDKDSLRKLEYVKLFQGSSSFFLTLNVFSDEKATVNISENAPLPILFKDSSEDKFEELFSHYLSIVLELTGMTVEELLSSSLKQTLEEWINRIASVSNIFGRYSFIKKEFNVPEVILNTRQGVEKIGRGAKNAIILSLKLLTISLSKNTIMELSYPDNSLHPTGITQLVEIITSLTDKLKENNSRIVIETNSESFRSDLKSQLKNQSLKLNKKVSIYWIERLKSGSISAIKVLIDRYGN